MACAGIRVPASDWPTIRPLALLNMDAHVKGMLTLMFAGQNDEVRDHCEWFRRSLVRVQEETTSSVTATSIPLELGRQENCSDTTFRQNGFRSIPAVSGCWRTWRRCPWRGRRNNCPAPLALASAGQQWLGRNRRGEKRRSSWFRDRLRAQCAWPGGRVRRQAYEPRNPRACHSWSVPQCLGG